MIYMFFKNITLLEVHTFLKYKQDFFAGHRIYRDPQSNTE